MEIVDHTLYLSEDLLLPLPKPIFSSILRKSRAPSGQNWGGQLPPKTPHGHATAYIAGADWLNVLVRAQFDHTGPGCVVEPKIRNINRCILLSKFAIFCHSQY